METNLKYINQICVDLGGTGGHILNVQGENEICTLLGGTGGHSLEINALNEICTIQGVTAGHSLVLNALNAIAGVTKVTNLEAWKYIQNGSVLNYEPEIDTYISGLTTPLSTSHLIRLNDLIKDLKRVTGNGMLSDDFDVINIRANETSEIALKNIVSDNYHSTSPSMPTFTQFEGMLGNGSGNYLDWNFTPKINGSKFIKDSASLGIYIRNNYAAASGTALGARDGGLLNRTMIYPSSSERFGAFLNTNAGVGTYSNINTLGLFIANRINATGTESYINGRKVGAFLHDSNDLTNKSIYELALNDNGTLGTTLPYQSAISFAGRGFSETEIVGIINAFEKYMISLNKNAMPYYVSYLSPSINDIQGYATDGINHYTFNSINLGNNRITKRNQSYTAIITNSDPFAGLTLNHMGDGDYHNGLIYVVAEQQTDVSNNSNQKLLIFNSDTLDRINAIDLSAQGGNIAGCTIVDTHGVNGIIYVVYFGLSGTDTTRICKYDLLDYTYLGKIDLTTPIVGMQGIAYKNNYFYITSHNTAGSVESVFKVPLSGESSTNIFTQLGGEIEGVDYSQDNLRILIFNTETNVKYINGL